MMRLRILLAAIFALGFGGDPGSSGGSITPYIPAGLAGADQTWQNFFNQQAGSIGGAGSAVEPGISQSFYDMLGIPMAGIANAGNQAGAYYTNMAGQADQFHNIMADQAMKNYGTEAALTGAGADIWNTSLDPQKTDRKSVV